MKAELIAVGSELLLGQIVNINAQIISQSLLELGIDVYYHTCVGDNQQRLLEVFDTAYKRSDLIITTGGLGPTIDDLTKETVASYLNLPLVQNQEALDMIKERFKLFGGKMTQNNYKQALLPEGAIPIYNKKGTAPGVLLNHDGKIIILLPGPPFEMAPMFRDTVIPYLAQFSSATIFSRVLKFSGIGESLLEEELKDLIINQTNPTIAPLAKMGEVTVRLTAKANNPKEAEEIIKPVEAEIKRRIGQYLYGYDDETIEEVVARKLLQLNKTIATAESCTGGLLASKLTDVPGSSNYFMASIISYSNESKQNLLKVNKATLENHGAVSEETAIEMAKGVRNTIGSDIGISTTGIAGPDGGTPYKPVGLVYIGYSDSQVSFAEKHLFRGSRTEIKERSALTALHIVRKRLNELGD